jgi:nucleoside-diphosphate-sugar epimerase
VSPRPRSVLVVGGGGFLAGHLLPRLVESGHQVFATHARGGAGPGLSKVEWIPCDLAGPEPTATWPACEAVVYLAQSRQWRRFPEGAVDVARVNVQSVHEAVEHARMSGSRRFVLASSGSVYDPGPAPRTEEAAFRPADPRSFYSASKLAAEMLLGPYSRTLATIVLRLFSPYGVGQDEAMLIPQLVRRVREGVPIDLQGPEGLRLSPVAAPDVAETMARVLLLEASATLNVAGPEVLSLRDVALEIGGALGREPSFVNLPGPDPSTVVGDTSAMRTCLGWVPPTPFARGVRDWLKSGVR